MKIVKLYNKYFFNFSNTIIIIILLLFLSVSYYLSINNLNEELSYEEVLQYYLENSLYFTKLITIIFSAFIFMRLKNEKNEYIINIVITTGYSKKQNYKYMTLSYVLIIIGFIIVSFIMFLFIGYISKHYFYLNIIYIISFLNILLISIYYGFISYLLILLFKNQFMFILIVLLFFISELFIDMNDSIKYIFIYFLPNINNYNGLMHINVFYVILLTILIYIINLYLYNNSDLKT